MADLDEILSFDHAQIKSKEAEILAKLLKFTVSARRQLNGARERFGDLVQLAELPLFVTSENLELAKATVKLCTAELFDVYAERVLIYFRDAEPCIALLPAIAQRVQVKLGTIDKDEAQVRQSIWESAAWDRQRPGFSRWLSRFLATSRDEPKVAAMHAPVNSLAENPPEIESGSADNHAASLSGPSSELHTQTPQSPSGRNESSEKHPQADRSDSVDAFLRACNEVSGPEVKILRKHIHLAAGHSKPRQFQRWQARDPESTDADEENFGRLLAMEPSRFVALLKKKGIIG